MEFNQETKATFFTEGVNAIRKETKTIAANTAKVRKTLQTNLIICLWRHDAICCTLHIAPKIHSWYLRGQSSSSCIESELSFTGFLSFLHYFRLVNYSILFLI